MAKNDKGTWAEESAGYKKWAEKEFGAGRYKSKKKKKKYTGKFVTRQPEIEWANLRRSKGSGSFGDAFKKHKAAGDKEFTWKGKKYHTRTKAELETGVAEKEKFERERKRKASPQSKGKKKSWLKVFGESKTLSEFAKKMKARKS